MKKASIRDLHIRTSELVREATKWGGAAQEIGEREIWTNDRHMPAAAPYFGLTGRSA